MYYKTIQPSLRLKKYIKRYWYAEEQQTTIREISPSINTCICFHLSDKAGYKFITRDFIKNMPENINDVAEHIMSDIVLLQNAIIGPHRGVVMETSKNGIHTFGIEFIPGVLNTFLGIPYDKISNNILPFPQTNNFIQELYTSIKKCEKENVFVAIDNYLIDKFLNSKYSIIDNEEFLSAINKILKNPFNIKSKEYSRTVEYMRKKL